MWKNSNNLSLEDGSITNLKRPLLVKHSMKDCSPQLEAPLYLRDNLTVERLFMNYFDILF